MVAHELRTSCHNRMCGIHANLFLSTIDTQVGWLVALLFHMHRLSMPLLQLWINLDPSVGGGHVCFIHGKLQ